MLAAVIGLAGIFWSGCRRIRPPVTSQPVPKTKPAATQAVSAPASRPAPKLLEYKVRQGDTIRKIAVRECGTSAAEWKIKKYNHDLDEKNLKVGQIIMIPEKKAKPAPPKK